jgi:DNA-binding NarL/FixJ family response regulator
MITKKKILIADFQYLIIEALLHILTEAEGFEIPAVVRSADELDKYLQNDSPDILIIDISILDYSDPDHLKDLKKNHPTTALIVLTNQLSREEITGLNKTGIKNILYKTAEKHEIFDAIHAALKGKQHYSSEIVDLLLEIKDRKDNPDEIRTLTGSEKEIVGLIARGLTTKEMARKKNISFHTVMTHRKNIFRKLGINNVSELMMYAMKNGLIDNIEYYI